MVAVLACLCLIISACTSGDSDSRSEASEGTTDTMSQTESSGSSPSDPAAVSEETAQGDEAALPATNFYEISTSMGKMVIRLYDETPQHRDNFKKVVADGTYEGTAFHRVIENFMIQGGDPNSKDEDPLNDGSGGLGYTVPAEFVPELFHKRGALAAARTGDQMNPERRSSSCQFYIVQGKVYSDAELDQLQNQRRRAQPPEFGHPGFTLSAEARKAYTTAGGTPFLDLQYTVYGELVSGDDVLDAIAGVNTAVKAGTRLPPQMAAMADQPPDRISISIKPLPDYPQ